MKKLYIVSRLQRTILWKEIWLVALVMILAINICHAELESKPSSRHGHTAVYDPTDKQMIIFGGQGLGKPLSDTWLFDTEKKTWEKMKVENTPPARWNHTAVYDSTGKQMIIFGGAGQGGALSDTWAFNIEKKTWEKVKVENTSPARHGHSAVYDPMGKQILIFGGAGLGGGALSDTWLLDIDKKIWEKVKVKKTPPARWNHSTVYDPAGKQMIIFGGFGQVGHFSDIWAFDIEKKTWEEVDVEETPPPPARHYHSAVYDPAGKQIIIFGGFGLFGYLSDTWIFDIEKRTWKEVTVEKRPPARRYHSTVYDSVNNQMLIFGGFGQGKQFFSDLWAYDIEKKTWKEISAAEDLDKGK